MAAVEGEMPASSWPSFRAQRTQAHPKHSLFGTALEHFDKKALEGINPSDASQIGVRKPRERYPIPEHLQQHVSARSLVERVKSDIKGQTQQVTDARKELQEKELQALTFKPSSSDSQYKVDENRGWMTKKDLEHAEEINKVGLSKSGSYNRDKYGKKPPKHNYSLIGDVLSKGNDFGRHQTYDPDQTLIDFNMQENNSTLRGSIRLGFNPKVDPDVECPPKQSSASPVEFVDLPPNIKHQFGSRICDSLFADRRATTAALKKKEKEQWRRAKPPLTVDSKAYEARSTGDFFEMSNRTRCNIFPGHALPKPQSCLKADHTEAVYLRRVVPPDEFRIVKDAYATWAEQNLVREKLKKQWDNVAPKANA